MTTVRGAQETARPAASGRTSRERSGTADDRARSGAVQRADLVAERIAQVGKVELAEGAFAPAGRVLDALAAVGDAGVVEGFHLLRAVAGEADGAAVGVRRSLAVDRLGDAEYPSLRTVEDAAFRVGSALLDADGAECGVIELLGCGDIVGADENMREHGVPPPLPGRPGSRARGSLIN